MKRLIALVGLIFIMLSGCSTLSQAQVAATTLPVYDFTVRLCRGTDITVTRLVTEEVSCLHDYSLSVRQVKAVEGADMVILSGAGLEAFMEDVLAGAEHVADASRGIDLIGCDDHHHDHHHEEEHHDDEVTPVGV